MRADLCAQSRGMIQPDQRRKFLWADDVSRTQAKPRAAYDYYQHLLLFLFLSLCSTTHLIGRRHNNIQHVVNHLTDRPSLQFSPVL